MPVEFNDTIPAVQMIAGLIRANNAGACSGEPHGVRYPGVPDAVDVCKEIGADPDMPLTEGQWLAACDVVCDDDGCDA